MNIKILKGMSSYFLSTLPVMITMTRTIHPLRAPRSSPCLRGTVCLRLLQRQRKTREGIRLCALCVLCVKKIRFYHYKVNPRSFC